MDQSALPCQCFYHWLLECVWWKESDFFRQRYWCSLLRLGPIGTIHQCYQDFVCLQLHSKIDNRRENLFFFFFKPLVSVVIFINSRMLCLSRGGDEHLCSVFIWIEFHFNSFLKVDLRNGTSSKVTFASIYLSKSLDMLKVKIREGSFLLLSCHQVWWPFIN